MHFGHASQVNKTNLEINKDFVNRTHEQICWSVDDFAVHIKQLALREQTTSLFVRQIR